MNPYLVYLTMSTCVTENYPVPKESLNFIAGALSKIAQNTRCTVVILPNNNPSDSHANCQLTGEPRQNWLAKKALSSVLASFNPRFRARDPPRKRSRSPPDHLEDGEIIDTDGDPFTDS